MCATASLASACRPTISTTGTTTTDSSTATSIPAGAKSAKFIFRQSSTTGSFDTPSGGGTVPSPGYGWQAQRVFTADGTLLADGGPTASAWPKWISSLEIGISGANNTTATNSDCMRFSGAADSAAQCLVNGVAKSCGAPSGYLRVSEYDCQQGTITDGTGGPSDGAYIRVNFNRDTNYLGSTENVMAVLEYSASVMNTAPATPTNCFTAGAFTPEACSDMVWRTYLKHSATEVTQPFVMLVPPALRATGGSTGTGFSTKQFVLPLAGDSTLKVFQISRVKSGIANGDATFAANCAPNGVPANSPFCVGMVFLSLTFFRI